MAQPRQRGRELFFILKGSLRIEMEDRAVELREGDAFVACRKASVTIRSEAEDECHVMIERKSTLHGHRSDRQDAQHCRRLRPV